MRVLVTGGAGYIGSRLVPRLLREGHQVRVLDCLLHGGEPLLGVWSAPGFELVRGDIRDGRSVVAALDGVDAVVHLAAIVGDPACARSPETAQAVNVDAALQVVGAAQQAGVSRFLFASTCSNYGKMVDHDAAVDEESQLHPVSLYAETKVAVERALLALDRRPMAATCLRFSTVYGVSPRMRFDLTVNHFTMELVASGALKVFGEQFWRPYIHVDDVAAAVATALAAPEDVVAGRVFNVGRDDQNFQKQQIVELILKEVPEGKVEYVHQDEDPRDYRVSFARIRTELGFLPARTVEQGIREVARLVRSGIIADYKHPRYRN